MQNQQEVEMLAMFRRISSPIEREFIMKTVRRYWVASIQKEKPRLSLITRSTPIPGNLPR
jgi:hypothetical protein